MENCDGFICGSNIKKGSIPADRLDINSLKEILKEVLKEFSKEDWFKQLICELGCHGTACTLEVDPSTVTFGPEGGTKTIQVITGGDWSITIS